MSRAKISSRNTQVNFTIERMCEHDLLEVVGIEETSGLSLWGWEAYRAELERHGSIMLVSRPATSFDGTGQSLIGFIAGRIEADELHINNVAVKFEYRRHGVGGRLIKKALELAEKSGVSSAILEVRDGNHVAQKLYHRCGFFVAGRRRRYYHHPVEDALIMTRDLTVRLD